jgi:hypothetical protein
MREVGGHRIGASSLIRLQPTGAQMGRFLRDHEEDSLFFLAAACVIAVGTITGILLALLALRW